MRANEYQTRAMSTRLPSCENATYMLFGLMAEIGEIATRSPNGAERECAGWIWIIWSSIRVICKRWRVTNPS